MLLNKCKTPVYIYQLSNFMFHFVLVVQGETSPCRWPDPPCKNGGTCSETPQGGYYCYCIGCWAGRNCTDKVPTCDDRPCQNDGECRDLPDRQYQCTCRPGFIGKSNQGYDFVYFPISIYSTVPSLRIIVFIHVKTTQFKYLTTWICRQLTLGNYLVGLFYHVSCLHLFIGSQAEAVNSWIPACRILVIRKQSASRTTSGARSVAAQRVGEAKTAARMSTNALLINARRVSIMGGALTW